MTLKRAVKLLYLYTKASQMISWQYRFSYFFRVFRIFFDFTLSYLIINIIFSQTSAIGGWTKPEIFLIYAIYQIVNSIVSFFCADSLDELDRDIRRGNLDLILVKPVDSQFAISFRTIFPSNIYRVIASLILMTYAFNLLHLHPSVLMYFWEIVTLISSCVIFYCFILFTSSTVFWTMRGEVVDLVTTVFSITRYPLDIFGDKAVKIFTVLPLIFLVTIPARILLGKPDFLHYFSPLIAVTLVFASRRFWLFALRHYASASS